MKNTLLYICLLAAFTCFAKTTFAATPVPGISVVVKRNPGGIAVNTRPTDDAGKMSVRLEGGSYEVSVDYNKIMETVARIDKNKAANNGCYKIMLALDPDTTGGITANGDTLPRTIELTKTTGNITLAVPAKGATIRFTLTWDSCKK